MTEPDLSFIAGQQERLLGEFLTFRDDLTVLTAMSMRAEANHGALLANHSALLTELRALHSKVARIENRLARPETTV